MNILEQIKAECKRHDFYTDCSECKLFDKQFGVCMVGQSPFLWNIKKIEKRLADANKTDNIS